MNPRASMPTTASTEPGLKFSVSRSIAPANSRASASTGVMSLNWIPGFGKSGTLRMARSISAGVTIELFILLFCAFQFFDHLAELFQREILDLPDALARDAKFFADFLQSFFRAAVESKTKTQN